MENKFNKFNFEQLFEERIDSNKLNTLFVVKGSGLTILELNKVDTLLTLDREEINNSTLDVSSKLADCANKLSTGKSFVILYEDFILCSELLVPFLTVYKYETVVIENNLFNDYYPIPEWVNLDILKHNIDCYDNCMPADIYDDYVETGDNVLVSYNPHKDIDGLIIVPLFDVSNTLIDVKKIDENIEVVSFGTTKETFAISLLNILNSQDKKIYVKKEKNILSGDVVELVKILSVHGYNIELVEIKTNANLNVDYSKYESILKRKNPNYTFKNIDFYTMPGLSLETTQISQGEIIDGIVKNALIAANSKNDYNDVFVTAPTGSGKSILFQIPAIYLAEKEDLFTIVISPLIGLMNDQVANIKCLTDKAATINSDYTPEEKEEVKRKIQNKEVSILYVSPETLQANNPITTLIGDRQVGLLIVDEAHIVSTWGKSFRPDYWFLGDYISRMRNKDGLRFPIATFSATVTYGGDDDMHGDIIDSLHMKTGKYEYIAPMRRDDISFDITLYDKENDYQYEKDNTVKKTLSFLLRAKKKTIAYFPYAKTVNDYSRELLAEGVSRYHGGLQPLEKDCSIIDYRTNKSLLMLATKAFGMGMDFDNVEYVYHYAPTGNLCDYVQEIGRAARKPGMNGVAMVDFYKSNDYKYINQLFGMSSIKNYQIVETLRKIAKIYEEKKKHNFTVSPDDFAYIFPSIEQDKIDTLFKTTLLMIQKDFEKMSSLIFKPITFRPSPLFTKVYVMVKDDIAIKFKKNRYSKYFTLYASASEMATKYLEHRNYYYGNPTGIDKYQSTIDTSLRYQGDVYVVDLKKMWEENFSDKSFGQFKYEFYNGLLNGFEIGKELLQEYILSVKSKVGKFYKMIAMFKTIMEEFDDIFSKNVYVEKHFDVSDLAKEIEKRKDVFGLDHYESIVAAQTFIQVVNNFKSSKQLINPFVFKFNSSTEKYSISSLNQLRNNIRNIIRSCENEFNKVLQADYRNFLVGNRNNDAHKDSKALICQLLETFNLGTYDVLSGERPEYFIRVNSITQIEKIINNPSYQSEMVRMVKKRHEDSKKRMTRFFVELDSDKERWDYIEKYFAGMQDEYEDDPTLDSLL